MARRFHRHRAAHPIADLNVTNLIDLGFILLVIFMIATPLIQNEQTLPVNLPKVSAMPQDKQANKDDKFLAVGVDAAGRFYIENKSTPLTLAELQSRLRAYAQEPKQPVVRIRGDGGARYQKVAELMAEVQKSGLTRVTFDSETDQ